MATLWILLVCVLMGMIAVWELLLFWQIYTSLEM